MTERKLTQMKAWLEMQQRECLRQEAALRADERQDEAVLQRIRGNVFSLSGAVLGAAAKQGDPEAFFLRRMEEIPANWITAREKALCHGDTVQAHLEEIKLEAAEEIRCAFHQIWSEEP